MWNIMKALNYQIKRDFFIIIGFLLAIAVLLIIIMSELGSAAGEMTGSEYLIFISTAFSVILIMLTLLTTSRICSWDFNDKTINYEVLAGHSRGRIFFARVLMSMLWGGGGNIVLFLAPIGVFTLMNGWGTSLESSGLWVRAALFLLTLFRSIAFWCLFSFLLKNSHITFFLGYLFFGTEMIISLVLEESFNVKLHAHLMCTSVMQVFTFDNSRPDYIGGKDVMVYLSALDTHQAVAIGVAALAVGMLCLLLGYLSFNRGDMT